MNRRHFIRLVGSGLSSVYLGGMATGLGGCSPFLKKFSSESTAELLEKIGPFDRTTAIGMDAFYTEDSPEFPHQVLWNKQKWLKLAETQFHEDPEETDIAIVGGGVSGLLSAYFLQDHRILLLEQAKRIGGNAKGSSWKGIDYTLATAYFGTPKPGSEFDEFLNETGLHKKLKYRNWHDPLAVQGEWYPDYWSKGTVPKSRPDFSRIRDHFEQMIAGENGLIYPDIPFPPHLSELERKKIEDLDRVSLRSYLEKINQGPLHPHLANYVEHYCWDAFGSSATEISAAHGLNFLVSEYADSVYFPGGNAAIAERVLEILLQKKGPRAIRPSSVVFDVKVDQGGVNILYLTDKQQIKKVRARTAILACPKFVVTKLIDSLEKERLDVIQNLKYRSFIVANVFIKQKLDRKFFELFFFNKTSYPWSAGLSHESDEVINVTHAGSAYPDPAVTVLTLYRPLPYDSGRKHLYTRQAQELFNDFESQIRQEILPLLSLSPENLQGIKITRWGHGMPVAQIGNIVNKKIDLLRKPYQERVFFVEQDNWTLPALETAFHEAAYWSKEVKRTLKA